MELLEKHRLWEAYLSNLGMPDDHLHAPADDLEHFIHEDLKKELQSQLDDVEPQK